MKKRLADSMRRRPMRAALAALWAILFAAIILVLPGWAAEDPASHAYASSLTFLETGPKVMVAGTPLPHPVIIVMDKGAPLGPAANLEDLLDLQVIPYERQGEQYVINKTMKPVPADHRNDLILIGSQPFQGGVEYKGQPYVLLDYFEAAIGTPIGPKDIDPATKTITLRQAQNPVERWSFPLMYWTIMIATLLCLLAALIKSPILYRLGYWAAVIGLLANAVTLVFRGLSAGRVPFSNEYESIILVTFMMLLALIVIQMRRLIFPLCAVVLPIVAVLLWRSEYSHRVIEQVMPALNSFWMAIHVPDVMLAYGILATAFGLGLLYLLRQRDERRAAAHDGESQALALMPSLASMESTIFKTIAVAFPILVVGVVLGAVWGEMAWGRYWGWDPKETWAFITTLVYAAYIHARLVLKWRGAFSAWFAVVGFVVVLFTYWGVNHWLSGLHSYGGE